MDNIYILGSGGFAKEVYCLILELNRFEVKAFIDIEEGNVIIGKKEIPIITEETFFKLNLPKDTNLALGTGNPSLNAKIVSKFDRFLFPNIIHPKAIYDIDSVIMGYGNIITAGVIMTTCINIGNFNILNLSVTVGHDSIIGNFNVINPTVNISGGVKLGDRNLLGVSSCILQYNTIGNDCVVGASALVTKHIQNNTTVVGIPAKPLKV